MRSLSPFFISFLLLAAFGGASTLRAANSGALTAFNSPLSAQRCSTIDNIESGGVTRTTTQKASVPAVTKPTAEKTPAPVVSAPESASVPSASYSLNREQLVATLHDQIKSQFNLEGDLQIELGRPWVEPTPSKDPITLSIVEFPNQISASMLVRVKAESNGAILSESTLVLKAQLWRDAWASRLPLQRDDQFDTSKLDMKRVDVLREREVIPVGIDGRSYTFARNIQSGRLLSWRDVSRRVLVRKGEIVDVSATDGLLVITMKALAMQNGAEGEIVSVRNMESKKDISAQVVGENRVQVRF